MRTGSSVRASTSRVAVICDPATATTRPIMLSIREVLFDAGRFPAIVVAKQYSISAVEGFHPVIEVGGFALPRKAAPVDCDRFDQSEDLASNDETQRLARTPGYSRQQSFAAEPELHFE